MSGEDNIGKQLRERLEGHASPVPDRVWEVVRHAVPTPPPAAGSPLPGAPSFSPLFNVLVKLVYAVSTTSLLVTAGLVLPGQSSFPEHGPENPVSAVRTLPPDSALPDRLPGTGARADKPPQSPSEMHPAGKPEEARTAGRTGRNGVGSPGGEVIPPSSLRALPTGGEAPGTRTVRVPARGQRRSGRFPVNTAPKTGRAMARTAGPSRPPFEHSSPAAERFPAGTERLAVVSPLAGRSVAVPTPSFPAAAAPAKTAGRPVQPTAKGPASGRWSVDLLLHGTAVTGPGGGDSASRRPFNVLPSGSVRLHYHLSGRLRVGSGLGVYRYGWRNVSERETVHQDTTLHYVYDWQPRPGRPDSVYAVVDSVWQVNTRTTRTTFSEAARATYVGIPLSLTMLGGRGRLAYSVSAGVQVNVLTGRSKRVATTHSPGNLPPGPARGSRRVVPMLTASAGVRYALSPRLALVLEPSAAYALTPPDKPPHGSRRSLLLGLTSGVRIAF